MSQKVFEIVTQRICDLLEKGTVPWRKPWKNVSGQNAPCNIMGYPYTGINFFLLSCMAHATPVYLTFNQIKKKGGKIKAGEEKNHFPVFFWKWLNIEDKNSGDEKTIPMCRYYQVWNIEQVEGIELPKRFQIEKSTTALVKLNEIADSLINNYKDGPEVKVQGNQACYFPTTDKVHMPARDQFLGDNEYYSVLFHELTHSTGHQSRLNRKELMAPTYFGSHDYSTEELCAEMGAAFMCAHCGIDNTVENSAAYIQGWLKKLKSDPKMLMMAAARAQKAFYHIAGQPERIEDEE